MNKEAKEENAQQPTPTPVAAAAPVQAPAQAPASNGSGDGLAITAMIIGIVSIILCWVPILGFLLGVGAIILGAIALKKKLNKGMSITGLITGILSTLTGIVFTVLMILGFASLAIFSNGLFGASQSILETYQQEQQQEQDSITAKKNFSVGETAVFGDFEVKINSITRNVADPDDYYTAGAGKEYIAVNVSVKNTSSSNQYISDYSFLIDDNGVANYSSYISILPEFDGGYITPNGTMTGNIVYEVTKDSQDLKLQYSSSAYSTTTGSYEDLIYTLDLY